MLWPKQTIQMFGISDNRVQISRAHREIIEIIYTKNSLINLILGWVISSRTGSFFQRPSTQIRLFKYLILNIILFLELKPVHFVTDNWSADSSISLCSLSQQLFSKMIRVYKICFLLNYLIIFWKMYRFPIYFRPQIHQLLLELAF